MRPRRLRVRIAIAFAVASLAIVGVLGIATYFVAQHYLVQQREDSLLRQAYVDARVFRGEIDSRQPINVALAALDLGPRSVVVLRSDGRWFGTSVTSGRESLPGPLRRAVEAGEAAHMRTTREGRLQFVVGLPLAGSDTQYYEVFALSELAATLKTLRNALAVGGLVAVAIGGLLGLWMSRLVLRPVTSFALAAERVATGDLTARLPTGDDPDLESLALSFNRMVDAVHRRIEHESRFVADVSHELRSPLTTLSTASQLVAARASELSPRAREAVELLDIEVRRLQELVEDLLELGRADAGVAELALEQVDVTEFVTKVLEANHLDVPVTQLRGPLTGDAARRSRIEARVDKRRLERVLTNLVTNAQMHGNGLTNVDVTEHAGVVRIAVDDDGPGVPAADREDVFARFFRGATAGRRASSPGSGLGLALVAEHVRLHGGRVRIEESATGGARFVVEVPVAQ